MRLKATATLALLLAALCATASFAEDRIPTYTGWYGFEQPASVWDGGRRFAIFTDPSNPLRANQEMFVLRGDDVVGLVLITDVGSLNVYGNFYSHLRRYEFGSKDRIAIPEPDALPMRLPNRKLGQVLFTSLAPDGRIWVVVDRGLKDGIDIDTPVDAMLENRKIGTVKMLFCGRTLSYGLLDREAIVPAYRIDETLIRFGDKTSLQSSAVQGK